MPTVFDHFRQCEIETGSRLRPCLHRDAKTSSSCSATVHGHYEGAIASRLVDRVCKGAHEHSVLHCDSGKVAGANADERKPWHFPVIRLKVYFAIRSARAPQPDVWRKEELFPRVRPNRVAEQGVVVAPL